MKCLLVSCFNAYDSRIKYIENAFKECGYETTYITSDFDHIKKEHFNMHRDQLIQINVMPYRKNISLKRIVSHFLFSKKVYSLLKCIKPDVLYIMVPPNSLAYFAKKYKTKHNAILIFDLYDLWPETFPNRKNRILSLFLKLWGALRNSGLRFADIIITECYLYQKQLHHIIKDIKKINIYPMTTVNDEKDLNKLQLDYIELCYLGSINNIIDIDMITKIIDKINNLRPVKLHIIGDGESRDILIQSVANLGVEVIFHGVIYEEDIKKEVFDKCMFGINIMKDTVCVGLTLKSIDYFKSGLPILNNIKGDTKDIIEKYDIGYNLTDENMNIVALEISNYNIDDIIKKKMQTRETFETLFSLKAFNKSIQELIDLIKRINGVQND